MILKYLPTGTIDLELIDGQVRIQFNCACHEALPYCQAACCRSRPDFNVHLTEDEAKRFPHRRIRGTPVLMTHQRACEWLRPDSRCYVHDEKPQACRTFHCSPRGGAPDGSETVRGTGFALTPVLPKV